MKKRMVTIWTIDNGDGVKWKGDCPKWASRPLPETSTITSERVLLLGKRNCSGVGCNH